MILTTDKYVAMVVVDRKEYVQEAKELLGEPQTYKPSLQIPPPDKGTG